MDKIIHSLKNQTKYLQNQNFRFNLSDTDKVAVIIEPRNLIHLQYIVYNVMYNLGPDWNLHVIAHDYTFIKECFPDCSFMFSSLSSDNLSPTEYNKLVKSVQFWNAIKEENVLIFQTDSCVMNKLRNLDLLKYSFIGGIYQYSKATHIQTTPKSIVGDLSWNNHSNQIHLCNSPYHHYSICGGFSFRKKSHMIHCINKVDTEMIIAYRNRYAMNIEYFFCNEIGEDIFFQHALELLKYELPTLEECTQFCENLCMNAFNGESFGIHNLKSRFVDRNTHINKKKKKIKEQFIKN